LRWFGLPAYTANPKGRPSSLVQHGQCWQSATSPSLSFQDARRNDGFLQRPTTPPGNPGVTLAAANTFPIGYYTNLNRDGSGKALPDLPVTGALAQSYTTLDRYFCSFAGETYPNRFYQHAAQTDRDHNSEAPSTLPTIWDQLSPVENTTGVPTGGYYYRDVPFLALWASPGIEPGATFKYQEFFHPFAAGDMAALAAGTSFVDACAAGTLPNVSFVDPAFDSGGSGTSGDDHPLSDIRLGERFIADAYHALADNGYLDNTVLVITFDEWGGFYDHVSPPRVIDETNPADVMHAGDSTTPHGRPSRAGLQTAGVPGPRHRRVKPGPARAGGACRALPALLEPGPH
jgi:phospholipase C